LSGSNDQRVALVHDWLTGMRGGEKVLEAIAALYPEAPIYTLIHLPGTVSSQLEAHPIRTSYLQGYPGARRHYRRYLPLFPAAIEEFDLSAYDVVISSSHCVAKGAIPGPAAFHLCYCHTPMRYAWDQEHVYFPRRTGLIPRLRAMALSKLRNWDTSSTHRVDLFVANSRFVAQRIRRHYGRQAEIVPPPADTDTFSLTDSSHRRSEFCLIVAALAPYKKVDVAIAACERLGLELRVVGTGPEMDRLTRLAGERTRFLGHVDTSTLNELYQQAICLLQPGTEDFGIASVEALACGCPVVALGRGGVLDIVTDGEHGVLYAGPSSPETLAAAIDKCRKIGFNEVHLRRKAEEFSAARFEARFRKILVSRLSEQDLP
jgi:glycosyltransferase involved in cell wall biosynthesis